MITIQQSNTTIIVRLNQENLVSEIVNLTFQSPSRDTIEFTKTLTTIQEGLYSFTLDTSELLEFIDDTYDYTISQNEVVLKTGNVRVKPMEITPSTLVFDYTLDFTLS